MFKNENRKNEKLKWEKSKTKISEIKFTFAQLKQLDYEYSFIR